MGEEFILLTRGYGLMGGGYTTIFFTRLYFYSRYEVETLQVVKLASLI